MDPCRYCGSEHPGICPLISAMTFYESGALKRVEFREEPRVCQHTNRENLGTMGWERWRCKDCGFQYEKDLNS